MSDVFEGRAAAGLRRVVARVADAVDFGFETTW
jgi:hypothetical protein